MSAEQNASTQAPDLRVGHWIDGEGNSRGSLSLAELGAGYKIVYCFQHWCPGCHSHGFPALKRLVDSVAAREVEVGFAVVQTVFEGAEENTQERLRETQLRYGLALPFGHDVGEDGESTVMRDYRTGGTPWFLVIDGSGHLVHSDFHVDVDRLLELLVGGTPQSAANDPSEPLSWSAVLDWARTGNVAPPRRVERTDAEWRARLTGEQFQVTRRQGTERPFHSEMCSLFEPGRYVCACCDTPLFDSSSKFDSRSGWPSFAQPLTPDVVAYHADDSHDMQRVEATCNVCDAHLGHVFPDGPEPTGLRFCINALSLRKAPAASS